MIDLQKAVYIQYVQLDEFADNYTFMKTPPQSMAQTYPLPPKVLYFGTGLLFLDF